MSYANYSFEEILDISEDNIRNIEHVFTIDDLNWLLKGGRVSRSGALIGNVLNIKPVMSATDDGIIIKLDQARGTEKALKKLAVIISEQVKKPAEKILAITHCNCKERALWMKEEISKLVNFKDITIAETAGVATMYANNGGIIISVE